MAKELKYKYVKLTNTIKVGRMTVMELEPQYLTSNGASAKVFQDEYGLIVEGTGPVDGEDVTLRYFIPYSGVRHIILE